MQHKGFWHLKYGLFFFISWNIKILIESNFWLEMYVYSILKKLLFYLLLKSLFILDNF